MPSPHKGILVNFLENQQFVCKQKDLKHLFNFVGVLASLLAREEEERGNKKRERRGGKKEKEIGKEEMEGGRKEKAKKYR